MSYINPGWSAGMVAMTDKANDLFAESVRVIPCERKPNFPSEPMESEAICLRAQFFWKPVVVVKQSTTNLQLGRDEFLDSRAPAFRFAKSTLPWSLKLADRVERCTGELFEIVKILPDLFHIDVEVVQLGRAAQ